VRSCAWLICLAGCGRLGFDAVGDATSEDIDASPPVGDPLISVDPTTLPEFTGPPIRVSVSAGNNLEDDDPCLTRDQLEIFFDSKRDNDNNDIFVARRASLTDPWSTPVSIAVINTNEFEEHPQISGDGLTLYYTSNEDIWRTIRADRDAPWEPPAKVAALSDGDEQAMGSVDARDLVLVLSTIPASLNTDELYESRRTSTTEPWGPLVPITDINTPSFDRSAHLDDYGLVMFYEYGAPARIRWSWRTSVGAAWSAPVNVLGLDGPSAESDPWLSPDLRTIYFAIDAGQGNKDIYTLTR